jgi:eukaryotic-like serine/threonine-protein kinase
LVGTLLASRYWIRNIIGVGGHGIVYEAEDTLQRRTVAVKIPRLARPSALMMARFRREARAGSSVAHPNVCSLYDAGVFEGGTPFLAMERLVGETVSARMSRDGIIELQAAVDIMVGTLNGLDVAHQNGFVHRDMKPSNIFLAELGGGLPPMPKVLDFGLSFFTEDEAKEEDEVTDLLTAVGTVVGTPRYMAPEQIRGDRDFDGRLDVFACGAILYEMVSGARAFNGSNPRSLCRQILSSPPPPVTTVKGDLPPALNRVLSTALAVDRESRFPSARLFSEALERLRMSAPTPVMSWSPNGESGPPGERLVYLQSRFRELAALHRSSTNSPSTARSTSSMEIPIVFEDAPRGQIPNLVPSDEDPEGTAPTKPRRNALRRDASPPTTKDPPTMKDPPSAKDSRAAKGRHR